MNLNRVELIGRLGSDPEQKNLDSGKSVANLSIAINTAFYDGNEWQNRTAWVRVTAWDKLAEAAAKLKKGQLVRIEAELRNREYTNTDGAKVQTYDIVAKTIDPHRTSTAAKKDAEE